MCVYACMDACLCVFVCVRVGQRSLGVILQALSTLNLEMSVLSPSTPRFHRLGSVRLGIPEMCSYLPPASWASKRAAVSAFQCRFLGSDSGSACTVSECFINSAILQPMYSLLTGRVLGSNSLGYSSVSAAYLAVRSWASYIICAMKITGLASFFPGLLYVKATEGVSLYSAENTPWHHDNKGNRERAKPKQ